MALKIQLQLYRQFQGNYIPTFKVEMIFFYFTLPIQIAALDIFPNSIIKTNEEKIEQAMTKYQNQLKRPCTVVTFGQLESFNLKRNDPAFQFTTLDLDWINVNDTLHQDGKNLAFGTGCTIFALESNLVSIVRTN